MIGSITRKSECITAVMVVLPAASACDVSAADSATTDNADARLVRFQREKWNIRISPDVKLVKTGLFVMQPVRYLGELTHCKACIIETCIKRAGGQSGFSRDQTNTNEGCGRAALTLQISGR